ncbi:augmin subunit 5 [Tanacetum coccineum]
MQTAETSPPQVTDPPQQIKMGMEMRHETVEQKEVRNVFKAIVATGKLWVETDFLDCQRQRWSLRYKYENNKLMDASPYLGSPLQLKLYGNGNIGHDASKGTQYHLFERHKFVATKDQLNKAEEARSTCQKLLKRLLGSSGVGFFWRDLTKHK